MSPSDSALVAYPLYRLRSAKQEPEEGGCRSDLQIVDARTAKPRDFE